MKIFLDTANLDEIKEANSWGILDGVTTNPTILSREKGKGKFSDILRQICEIVDGPVSGEVIALDAKGMVTEALELSAIHENITIKVPMLPEGLKAVRELSAQGIKTNMTLVFTPSQAILAAKAGATFVSPFIGRLDDISHFGMDIAADIITIYENYGFETEVIIASVRHPLHVVEAGLCGADIVTMPFGVLERIVKHPLTDSGIKRFLEDWEKVQK
ncbi:MAG: fructose-6-phosphate aldolase [Candidatus Zixiibacteriota bacterium]|nr:MAG: fructose-6-phosphate aldolase [candidate division Zixibacteria bacterium]